MGLRASIESLGPDRDFDARLVFLEFESINRLPEAVVYKFNVRYQRYTWYIIKRFSEFKKLDGLLRTQFPNQMSTIPMPKKFSKMFWSHSDQFLRTRGENLKKYMTLVLDYLGADIFYSVALKQFFEIGPTSFRSEMGRKGKEGFLQKSSGGYLTNFSSTLGDYFKFWNTRYIVVHDNHIAYYKSYEDEYPSGSLQIDQGLQVWANGRLINVRTLTRRLILFASSKREAEEWRVALEEFYAGAVRRLPHKFGSAYAPRPHCPVRVCAAVFQVKLLLMRCAIFMLYTAVVRLRSRLFRRSHGGAAVGAERDLHRELDGQSAGVAHAAPRPAHPTRPGQFS